MNKCMYVKCPTLCLMQSRFQEMESAFIINSPISPCMKKKLDTALHMPRSSFLWKNCLRPQPTPNGPRHALLSDGQTAGDFSSLILLPRSQLLRMSSGGSLVLSSCIKY